ncbi:hypothetical protein BYT27DRAFT_7264634 [Phlegmacium glaucopus]|nr:hypothetical protein BYT27DRAFT_7264634 [Phlegmacium glaucopus]
MPAPYPLLDMPPGNFTNKFDFWPSAHNTFVQGINAIAHHAPTVNEDKQYPPSSLYRRNLLFPRIGRKTRQRHSQREHKGFLPGVEALEEWCKKEEAYDANVLLGLVDAFGDAMIAHLASEISTLDHDAIQAKFTIAELDAIEAEFKTRALGLLDIYTTLPMSLVCASPNALWFPAFPTPLKWATRWWYPKKHSEAWEFGPMDFSGKERVKV